LIDEPVLEVTGPGTLGEFGVLPNHAAFLTSLETGRLTYKDARGVNVLAIRSGFAEVSNNVMTVLVDAAERADEIDAAKAEKDRREAEERLKDLSPLDAEYAAAEGDRRWAQARLDATKR
jgi:F-type H+-transporting ATPase subunit epsilon